MFFSVLKSPSSCQFVWVDCLSAVDQGDRSEKLLTLSANWPWVGPEIYWHLCDKLPALYPFPIVCCRK